MESLLTNQRPDLLAVTVTASDCKLALQPQCKCDFSDMTVSPFIERSHPNSPVFQLSGRGHTDGGGQSCSGDGADSSSTDPGWYERGHVQQGTVLSRTQRGYSQI